MITPTAVLARPQRLHAVARVEHEDEAVGELPGEGPEGVCLLRRGRAVASAALTPIGQLDVRTPPHHQRHLVRKQLEPGLQALGGRVCIHVLPQQRAMPLELLRVGRQRFVGGAPTLLKNSVQKTGNNSCFM